MALTQCPECKKIISSTASSCPGCGYSFAKMKFCKFCGSKIAEDSVVCVKCGRQVESMGQSGGGGITINNAANANASAAATSQVTPTIQTEPREVDKNVALTLCVLLGWLGAHKFYEGKSGMGILYLFTCGLFCIGWIVDIAVIAGKSNPYYV